jgi:hypothetical protein
MGCIMRSSSQQCTEAKVPMEANGLDLECLAGGVATGSTPRRSDVVLPDQRSIEWILSAVIVRITRTWSGPPYHW